MKDNLLDYDYIFDWSENNHKDFSKSDSKENSNLVMRIQKNKDISEKENNLVNFNNYTIDRLKTIQEDYNNIDDNNKIGMINCNQYKFISTLNSINFNNEKPKIINETKEDDNIININENKENGCRIF